VEKRSEFLGVCGLTLGLPQHPDEHRSERPLLLAVDQQLSEGAFADFPSYTLTWHGPVCPSV